MVGKDGKTADLVRQIPGVKTAQVKDRLKDIEATLPAAKDIAGRQSSKHRDNEKKRRSNSIPDHKEQTANQNQQKAQTKDEHGQSNNHKPQDNAKTPERDHAADQERFKQKAKQAGENFAEVINPERELTNEEKFAQQLESFRKKEREVYNRAYETQQNKADALNDSKQSEFEQRLQQARENLNNDDFDLSR